jgi:dihydrolipoamide dehydrogenase
MNIVSEYLRVNPKGNVAVIDKDEPGGICLTRACIPTKILLHHADLVKNIRKANDFGIRAEIREVNFRWIMDRMRKIVREDISSIERGLNDSDQIDYLRGIAGFEKPYTLKVGDVKMTSDKILLCTGSKPLIPKLRGLEEAGYLTSDSILKMDSLPESMLIVGGGYVGGEYGYFLSQMGCDITIIGRNPQFLPQEEPEVSHTVRKKLSEDMQIYTGYEVMEVQKSNGSKIVIAKDSEGNIKKFEGEEILMAVGRASNSDILHPEKGGIETDERGWIKVNEYLETSMKGVYAFGDANGKFLFKHVANYESSIVFKNAILNRKEKVDYSKVPHAIFTNPEIAGVGLKEREAIKKYGRILIGYYPYEYTGKGVAMGSKNYFTKVILREDGRIVGASIVGDFASILIHEIVALMNLNASVFEYDAMHIHPSLSEVVERALYNIMSLEEYNELKKDVMGA